MIFSPNIEKERQEREEAERVAAEGKCFILSYFAFQYWFNVFLEKARREKEEAERKAAEGTLLIEF